MSGGYRANKSGFAAEAQKKIEANYDLDEAKRCLGWVQIITGVDEIPSDAAQIDASVDSFYEILHSGTILCKVMDKLMPGKINWGDRTFQTPGIEAMRIMRERERISLFTKMALEYGLTDNYVFPTESLHEQGALNLAQVCICIRALGMEAQTKPDYQGPENYWPKKGMKNKREFTEEQLKAGQGIIGLQMGSNKGASQAGSTMGKQRMIID